MKGTYLIAEHIVELHSLYPYVHNQCAGYRYNGINAPDIRIRTVQADIDSEQRRSDGTEYPDDYLESLAVYRRFAEAVLEDGYLLLHASAISVDHMAYLFAARSGTGKSTHTKLWMEYFGERALMINDDKPVVKVCSGGRPSIVFGTPWAGKHRRSANTAVTLKAICFLNRGTENTVVKMDSGQAYPLLLQQCLRVSDKRRMEITLKLLDQLAAGAAMYRLECNMELSAAAAAYEGMQPL